MSVIVVFLRPLGLRLTKIKKVIAAVGATTVISLGGVFAAGSAFAQTPTPSAPSTQPATPAPRLDLGRGLGILGKGGSFTQFDAMATALNLTPTQLFEQLHSGKTLDEIATAQGVDLTKVQEAANAARVQAEKDAIAQAVKDGTMTQAEADWRLEGLANGYMPVGRGGHGGHGGRGGFDQGAPGQAPTTPATPGATS